MFVTAQMPDDWERSRASLRPPLRKYTVALNYFQPLDSEETSKIEPEPERSSRHTSPSRGDWIEHNAEAPTPTSAVRPTPVSVGSPHATVTCAPYSLANAVARGASTPSSRGSSLAVAASPSPGSPRRPPPLSRDLMMGERSLADEVVVLSDAKLASMQDSAERVAETLPRRSSRMSEEAHASLSRSPGGSFTAGARRLSDETLLALITMASGEERERIRGQCRQLMTRRQAGDIASTRTLVL